MSDQNRIALVTGANKGIGLEIARQLAQAGASVIIGARNTERARNAVETLSSHGLAVESVLIDLNNHASIAAAAETIGTKHGRLDILVNNAGIGAAGDGAPSKASVDAVRQVFETNFFGALAVTQTLLPLLRLSDAGRIINLSSSLASLKLNGDPSWEAYDVRLLGYSASKTALNMLTVQLAAELQNSAITVHSVCPGLTATDLNGHAGDRTPSEGAVAPARMALEVGARTGHFTDAQGGLPW